MSDVKSVLKHPVLFVLSLVLCLVSLIPAIYGANISKVLFAAPDDMNGLTRESVYESEIVSGQIFGCLGTFGQTYKTDENGNIISEDDMIYYYLVPISNDYSIALVTDDKELIGTLNVLTEATNRYRNGETESIEYPSFDYGGMLMPLSDDELTHMYTWILETKTFNASTVEEAANYVIPYKIYEFDRSYGMPYVIGGSVGFLVFAILMICLLKNRILVNENGDVVNEEKNSESK